VPGVSGSGGSETQNICYDEQNRLVWAGNGGTQPGAGNGTCGSGTLANSLSGAGYSSSYVYTHLGHLWQGPQSGSSTASQYLYCDSTHPHQLTGLYSLGSTCSNKQGQTYTSSYDAWGNVTGRTVDSTSATLSYDGLDHLTSWNAGNTGQEQYIYDAGGQRVLRRSTSAGNTSMTVYAFGLEEHHYSGTGVNQGNTYYYSLGGLLVGEFDGTNTNMYLTDALGSVLSTISATPGSAAVQGNQVYGPYGTSRYQQGQMNTTLGFTGQYNDSLTGLDYYGARYYDPVVGRFLSVDPLAGNLTGMDPYSYVGNNPETNSDPTGLRVISPGGQLGPRNSIVSPTHPIPTPKIDTGALQAALKAATNYGGDDNTCQGKDIVSCFSIRLYTQHQTTVETNAPIPLGTGGGQCLATFSEGCILVPGSGRSTVQGRVSLLVSVTTPFNICVNTAKCLIIQAMLEAAGEGGGPKGEEESSATGFPEAPPQPVEETVAAANECGPLSFAPETRVTTDHGEQAIGTLQVGERVLAYNPKTGKMELEPILHVWINHDHDLVDLTITTTTQGQQGKTSTKTNEVIHTNQKHPFFTLEQGFLPVGKIRLGMHILRADGNVGVVTGWQVVPGTQVMYNLEVAQDHTFTVGTGQWVVHNCAAPTTPNHLDIVSYDTNFPPRSGFQKHHGVLDRWAEVNIPGYDQGDAPAVVLTDAEHTATRSYFANWRIARTGNLGGYIDWSTLPPREVQDLAYGMFNAAGVPSDVVADYFRAFHQYIYSLP